MTAATNMATNRQRKRPSLAVWKFSSCDGCQLSLLDCEDELLALADAIDIAYFPEATSRAEPGPYDISLVEGSVATAHDVQRIRDVRNMSKLLVTIGACATAGGIQALRNYHDVAEFAQQVYARPDLIDALQTSTAIGDHVRVDFELRGCPVDKGQLVELVNATLHGRRPDVPVYSVCEQCKRAGNVCVMVAHGTPCLGPVTQAGCGAICPGFDRGCYGCFGPAEQTNTVALGAQLRSLGVPDTDIVRLYSTYNTGAEPFREAREAHQIAGKPAHGSDGDER